MRDRVLLALEAEAAGEEPDPLVPTAPTEDAVPEPRGEVTPSEPTDEPTAGDRRPTAPVSPRRQRVTASRPASARPKARPDTWRGLLAGARGRLAIASLALLTLVGSLAGMSVLLARDALPGDALYGVKRTAEAASLGLTFGDEPKALKHLEFAAARVTEIEALARQYPNPADAPVGGYLTALTDFDNDALAGSRQLIALATSADGRLLDSLRDWSAQQADRLRRVDHLLPGAAHSRASASRALLDRITARSNALLARMDCDQTTSGMFDDIGALPATGPCDENPAATSTEPLPSVPATPDSSAPVTPDGPATPSSPLPPTEPTSQAPPVPVPGTTVSVPVPLPSLPGTPTTTTTTPLVELPPVLPGLPGVSIG